MYNPNDTLTFDDTLDGLQYNDDEEMGGLFGDIVKFAAPLVKVASAIGIPGAGAVDVGLSLVGGGGGSSRRPAPPSISSTSIPSTVLSSGPATGRGFGGTRATYQDKAARGIPRSGGAPSGSSDPKVDRILAIMEAKEVKAQVARVAILARNELRYKKSVSKQLKRIVKQLAVLSKYIHLKLGSEANTISPAAINILGGRDFVSRLGR